MHKFTLPKKKTKIAEFHIGKALILFLTRTNLSCCGIWLFTVSRNYLAEFNPARSWDIFPFQEVLSILWAFIQLLVTKDLGLCPPSNLIVCVLIFYYGCFYLKQTQYERANVW